MNTGCLLTLLVVPIPQWNSPSLSKQCQHLPSLCLQGS